MQVAGGLVGKGEEVYFLQVQEICIFDGLMVIFEVFGVQMVWEDVLFLLVDFLDMIVLGDDDVVEMLVFVSLIKFGLFLIWIYEMGQFWGIWIDG